MKDKPNLWERVKIWFGVKPPCRHFWRPCVVLLHTWGDEKRPAAVCTRCNDWRPLTPEQFFAEFGESFWILAHSHPAKGRG